MSEIALLPADKGNVTMLMKKDDYHAKIKALLDSGTYKVLKGDPTPTHENRIGRKLRELVKQGEMSESFYQTLRTSDSQPSRIYGLPKVHKPEVPLRPIVSCIRAPSYCLSKHIAMLLAPLSGRTNSHVKNTKHFVQNCGRGM